MFSKKHRSESAKSGGREQLDAEFRTFSIVKYARGEVRPVPADRSAELEGIARTAMKNFRAGERSRHPA